MLSLGKSDIKDNNLCNILLNFVAKAIDLLHYHSPLLSFEDIRAQEESLLPDNRLDNVAPLISKSLTTKAPCLYTLAPTPLWPNSDQE
jgi:hypothetical protein